MADILPFLKDSAFDPAMTHIMGEAYDKACRALHDRGQPHVVQEVIARCVIEAARTGERDPDRLSQAALRKLGFAAG